MLYKFYFFFLVCFVFIVVICYLKTVIGKMLAMLAFVSGKMWQYNGRVDSVGRLTNAIR